LAYGDAEKKDIEDKKKEELWLDQFCHEDGFKLRDDKGKT
jgi:hypothetical protein